MGPTIPDQKQTQRSPLVPAPYGGIEKDTLCAGTQDSKMMFVSLANGHIRLREEFIDPEHTVS